MGRGRGRGRRGGRRREGDGWGRKKRRPVKERREGKKCVEWLKYHWESDYRCLAIQVVKDYTIHKGIPTPHMLLSLMYGVIKSTAMNAQQTLQYFEMPLGLLHQHQKLEV